MGGWKDPGAGEQARDRSQQVGHRHYRRFPVSMPVVGRAARFAEGELHGMVRNIGGGGLMAEFPVMVLPGSAVDLTLQTRHGPLAVSGEVAWAGPPGTQIGHGIAFREPRGDAFALELCRSEQG